MVEIRSNCRRCQEDFKTTRMVHWNGMWGAVKGSYCQMCWEITMSMWVMTQNDRKGCLAIVDDIIKNVRKELQYVQNTEAI
jgi:hypothetical protein